MRRRIRDLSPAELRWELRMLKQEIEEADREQAAFFLAMYLEGVDEPDPSVFPVHDLPENVIPLFPRHEPPEDPPPLVA